jgi:amino acid transporter
METDDVETRRDADAEALGRLGYAQELTRRMGGFSNFALSFSIICILAGGITAFPGGLGAGGGASIGLGWPVGALFAGVVALAMAQIASAFSWVTFTPCFLWIFLGAPYVEALRGNRALTAALSAITAAVVGVIANLAIWFAFHVVFSDVHEEHLGPVRVLVPHGIQLGPTLIAIAAAVALLCYRVSLGLVLTASAALGLIWHLSWGP